MSDPLRTPERTTPPREHDVPARWGRWQDAQIAQHALTPEAAARGYTALKVHPSLRPAFFALVELLSARVHFEDQLPHVLDAPEVVRAFADAQAAWVAWHTWTRRFAAYLDRIAAGRAGTLPPVPDALTTLLDDMEETNAVESMEMLGIRVYLVHGIYTVISRTWLCRASTSTPHFTL